ncbi:MAG: two pore domain potassium channel family protein [Bacteroidia bacterium]|nr:two pore domain potassium channel family protein [Bacteroidia bacterium]
MLESPIHAHHLLRYSVELLDQPLSRGEQTALVSFYDENNKRVSTHKFAVIPLQTLYEWIEKGESINLNSAYIHDFSLRDYRVSRGLDDSMPLVLKDFTAKRAFFDCDTNIDFSHSIFTGDKTIFESAIFGNGYVNFYNSQFKSQEVNFKKVKFGSGSTTFQSSNFGDGAVNFFNANFGTGNLSFIDTNFGNGNVDFRNAYFGDGTVDFKFAKFAEGDISFQRASFENGKKDFKNVEFGGGKLDFRGIEFNDGDVSFEGVEFGNGRVNFRNCKFGHGHKNFELADFADGEAQFEFVSFGSGSVSFNRSKVKLISFNGCHLNCFLDLRFDECASLDLSNTVVRDVVDLKPQGESVVIKELSLVDMRILGRLFINWRENQVYDLIYVQKGTSLFQKAEQFRILKENFRNNGQYDDEDDAYLEFKRCEARALFAQELEESKFKGLKAYPTYWFKKVVFDQVGHYGTAPVRVLFNAMGVVLIFSLLYFGISNYLFEWGHVATTLPDTLNVSKGFWNSVYYSSITFFTVGYGDYFAYGAVKILAAMEGFVGVFLMSYFTVAFVRKILR